MSKNIFKRTTVFTLLLSLLLATSGCQLLGEQKETTRRIYNNPDLITVTATDFSDLLALNEKTYHNTEATYTNQHDWKISATIQDARLTASGTLWDEGANFVESIFRFTFPAQKSNELMSEADFSKDAQPLLDYMHTLYDVSKEELLSYLLLSRKDGQGFGEASFYPYQSSQIPYAYKKEAWSKESDYLHSQELSVSGGINEVIGSEPAQYAETVSLMLSVPVEGTEKLPTKTRDLDINLADAKFEALEKTAKTKAQIEILNGVAQKEASGFFRNLITRPSKAGQNNSETRLFLEIGLTPFNTAPMTDEPNDPHSTLKTFGSQAAARKALYSSFLDQVPEAIRSQVASSLEDKVEQAIDNRYVLPVNESGVTAPGEEFTFNKEGDPFELYFAYSNRSIEADQYTLSIKFACNLDEHGKMIQ